MLFNLWHEALQIWRGMLRRPGFSWLAILTLAVGFGVNIVAFSLIERLLLQPLPYQDSHELHAVGLKQDDGWVGITPREFQAFSQLEHGRLAGVARVTPADVAVQSGDMVTDARAIKADADFLDVLDIRFFGGRNFDKNEIPAHGPGTEVIISWRFWQQRFNADSSALGSTLNIEGVPMVVVGVLPREFRLEYPFDIVLPLSITAEQPQDGRNFFGIMRAEPGTVATEIEPRLREALRALYVGSGSAEGFARADFGVKPLSSVFAKPLRELLSFFMIAALCVLLLASVNFINLMNLRILATRDGRAMRGALGASRFRLTFPLIAESLPIGLFGAGLGVVLASLGSGVWVLLVPEDWRALLDDEIIGTRTLLFAFGVGLIPVIVASVLGSWKVREFDEGVSLGSGDRTGPDCLASITLSGRRQLKWPVG